MTRGQFAAAAILISLVAACAQPMDEAPSQETITTARSVSTLADELEATLRGLGFEIVETSPRTILARASDSVAERYAACRGTRIRDPFVNEGSNRQRIALPLKQTVNLGIALEHTASGSAARIDARYIGVYNNSFVNRSFERSCAGTGALEDALFQAATT